MAKKIFLGKNEYQTFIDNITAQLSQNKYAPKTSQSFTFAPSTDERKAKLKFNLKAWSKMKALVEEYTTEVEWHCLVDRVSENEYFVKDVLVFPHTVTAVTVVSDQAEYEKWLNTLDDETFNHLRMHGHSHVNMGVTPSSVDENYRESIIKNFGKPCDVTDYFYIFMIINKRGEISLEIYDIQNDALYDTKDTSIEVTLDDGTSLNDFIKEARNVAKTKVEQLSIYPKLSSCTAFTHNRDPIWDDIDDEYYGEDDRLYNYTRGSMKEKYGEYYLEDEFEKEEPKVKKTKVITLKPETKRKSKKGEKK